MVITYLGGECFKITQGDLTVAFNPPSKDATFKAPKFGADIVLVSLDHPDFNGVEQAAFGDRQPFVISGPGEYEVRGVAVRGFASKSNYGGAERINTIYSVSLEGVNLCFLGAQGSADLPPQAMQELDGVDILFVPIGGEGVLDAAQAEKVAVQLEPKAVVPMHYPSTGSGRAVGIGKEGALKAFLKESGEEGKEPQEKLTVKKKDLDGKEGEVIVLQS